MYGGQEAIDFVSRKVDEFDYEQTLLNVGKTVSDTKTLVEDTYSNVVDRVSHLSADHVADDVKKKLSAFAHDVEETVTSVQKELLDKTVKSATSEPEADKPRELKENKEQTETTIKADDTEPTPETKAAEEEAHEKMVSMAATELNAVKKSTMNVIADRIDTLTDEAGQVVEKAKDLAKIPVKSIDEAVEKIKHVVQSDTTNIQELLEKQRTDLLNSPEFKDKAVQKMLKTQALELEKQFESMILHQKQELEALFSLTLQQELSAKEKELTSQMHAQLQKQAFELEEFWSKKSIDMIKDDRRSRLDQVDKLALKLQQYEYLALQAVKTSQRYEHLLNIMNAVSIFKTSLAKKRQVPLKKEYELLAKVASHDPFMHVLLDSIPAESIKEGVPTVTDLSERFNYTTSNIRRVQLMPEDGNPLTYSISYLVSYLIFPKSGLVRGGDPESIVARSRYYLEKGDLDKATRELNQLKGKWVRGVARDWLVDARRHLIVKQALEVIYRL
jgi:mitofilin